jgi:hypothetical protein
MISLNYFFEKYVIFNSEISGAYKINRILNKTKNSEIPIFGSSRAQGNFVPSILGDNYFNYGIDGTQANIWLFFLEQELKKEKSTPIIINFDLEGLVYSDGDIGNYIPNWENTESILISEREFYYNVPLLKYFGKFELYTKYFLNDRMNLTNVTDNGGSFVKTHLTQDKFQEAVSERHKTETLFILDNVLLEKFNSLIASTSRQIILVTSPYHKAYFNKFNNIDDVNNYMSNLKLKKNILIIDLRNYIQTDSMFMNTTHLNYEGAVKFSNELNNRLTYYNIGDVKQ